MLVTLSCVLPASAVAERASEPAETAAGRIDVGALHTCAIQEGGSVRCWGYGPEGELGYPLMSTVGDDETPGSVGPVNVGAGRTATQIAVGDFHTCALLDDGTVRCWGFGADGRLGYGNTQNIGDNETPGMAGPVNLGAGRTAVAITAGSGHTCAVLDDGAVRCWGFGEDFRLGRNDPGSIGDDESPGSVAPVNLDRDAVALSAGLNHTCATLDDGAVRCWGLGRNGQLGYGDTRTVGDPMIAVDSMGNSTTRPPVILGVGRTAAALSAGGEETCAVLDDGNVRCWGYGGFGRLGYGNFDTMGDNEHPGSAGPVNIGAGRTAKAVSVGDGSVCARLDDGSLRCWGLGGYGALGYGNRNDIGDTETPNTVGPVHLGTGRSALAVSVGRFHTCARLDDGSVRCWGLGDNGLLGYCSAQSIGDDETPAAAGPVDLGAGGASCVTQPTPDPPPAATGTPATGPPVTVLPEDPLASPPPGDATISPFAADALRASGLRTCLAAAQRRARRRRSSARRKCLRRFGRTPGRVTGLRARALSGRQIELRFAAPGTDGGNSPPAVAYLVKQSPRPIRSRRAFDAAHSLCRGSCRFAVQRVGEEVTLTVTDLRPRTAYAYAIVARDNVTARRGPRSRTVSVRTR